MQYRIIYKKFTLSWAFSLLMMIFLTAIADSNNYQYSLRLAAGEYNPWALPQAPENYPGFQQAPKYQNQQYQNQQYQNQSSQNRAYQRDRFVTPEFLESLKQQQSQQQTMPENERHFQFAPEQSKSQRPGSGSFANPSYGMDYLDSSYDTPAVIPWSPWGIGSDTW